MKEIIKVKNLSKCYKVYDKPLKRVIEPFLFGIKSLHQKQISLKDVSFSLFQGDSLGIVGKNGAGKSTLLKIITSITTPSEGLVEVNGKISSIIELGAGFNPEMTGRENALFNIRLVKRDPGVVSKCLKEAIEFSEIESFIDRPVKTYSSGMLVRLAYSVAAVTTTEILIIDEALAVGDISFQQKCIQNIKKLIENKVTIIFVSHDAQAIRSICNKAILLEDGELKLNGTPSDILETYYKKNILGLKTTEQKEIQREFSSYLDITKFELLNEDGKVTQLIESESYLKVSYTLLIKKDIKNPHYGIVISDRFGNSAFETNTYCMNIDTNEVKEGESVNISFVVNELNIIPGKYTVSFGVSSDGYGEGLFRETFIHNSEKKELVVLKNSKAITYDGYCNLKPKFSECVL